MENVRSPIFMFFVLSCFSLSDSTSSKRYKFVTASRINDQEIMKSLIFYYLFFIKPKRFPLEDQEGECDSSNKEASLLQLQYIFVFFFLAYLTIFTSTDTRDCRSHCGKCVCSKRQRSNFIKTSIFLFSFCLCFNWHQKFLF